MSNLSQILSRVAANVDAIEDRVTGKVDEILDESVLSSPMANFKTPKAGEVTLFGHFVWDPELTDQEEIEILLSEDPTVHWSPSVLDFMEATDLSPKYSIGGFEALLAEIAKHKPDSISRLNFFTHGNSVLLGMSGTIDSSNVYFDSYIDEVKLDFYAQDGLSILYEKKGKAKEATIADIRQRFKENAVFVVYSCNSAVETGLLKSLSQLLNVTIIGFNNQILYCPPVQDKPPFKRKNTRIGISKNDGGCSKNAKVKDWRSLINDESAVRVQPG